ncbi:RagB/SusD family nutrient uptake outer membrane protein [Galbibacter sp.]|uniref:RagB/SusD family nutrient uptake outer membrane protein n=1 Tax=Galbibacter sp. TaxID=2918471 RepID=UPI003A8E8F45
MRFLNIPRLILLAIVLWTGFSCTELDLVQQDAASVGSWYTTEDQFRQSVNELYRTEYWIMDALEGWTDDVQTRSDIDQIQAGTLSSEFGHGASQWFIIYKGITRANVVAEALEKQNGVLTDEKAKQFIGEVNFARAFFWTYLITHYGDVPFYEGELTIEESFEVGRTNKQEILQKIYEYYDIAVENLPESYSGTEFATKGAAYALKARSAIYLNDFETAAAAAKECMDLGVYKLHPDFQELFLPTTKSSKEIIFKISRSKEFNVIATPITIRGMLPRTFGGYAGNQPSWPLLASFECVDGLPIDESPLFDPRNPFKNRDPRLLMTIVPFGSLADGDGRTPDQGTEFLGVDFTSHPEHKQIMSYLTNKMVTNNDTRSIVQWASFNGLYWKKSLSEDWKDYNTDPDRIIIRYADVLLMYAEAKIELNQIDQSVLDAMNEVRDRAYAKSQFTNPEITTTDQSELRFKVRNERRSEFALEGLRYMDLIRWKLAVKAMSGNIYGMLNVDSNANVNVAPTGKLMDDIVEPGLWFWGLTPEIDQDGLPQFENLLNAGMARVLNKMNFPERQYLWPIPQDEILLNDNLTQNPGY